ncbi:MAG TPA: FecR family protein, partial [Thermoanaerobaculia bacterium]|nr:FecR family protein [Thermoanaerobaculia bacterium]
MRSRLLHSLILGFAAVVFAALPARAERSGYAHVTDVDGSGSVLSDANGRTEIQINLPLAEGDQIVTNAGGHAEIELADGNRVQIAGESRVRLDALAAEEGSEAGESAITLLEGSLAAESAPVGDTRAFRIDTADTSVYVPSQGRVRVNLDANRGTSVIVRAGSADVQTRSGAITAEAGQYVLVHGDQEPELAHGTFSRDRFDIWVADRTETALEAYNSTSSRYVDGHDYDQDAAALDNSGSWDYSSTSDSEVWRPDVPAGWSPYSDGYWYYTPAGATWVGNEPWGWLPYHYGNWFFDAGFGSWCWSPSYAYSPGWVYWGFSPGWVGWCPIGYYSYYGPYGAYWGGYGGWNSGLYFAVNGSFDCGHVDWNRGWNFVGSDHFGSHFHSHDVMPGSAVASRLGSRISISSEPVRPGIVSGRGSAQTALRSFARSAPATIAGRSSPGRSAALEPFLARRSTLPPATVRTLQDENLARVNGSSRRLEGPGADRLAPSLRAGAAIAGSRTLSGGAFRNPGSPRSEAWRSAPNAGA